jgi:ApbE superfamily uncharacterized protein (UPF0280 family)
MSILVHNSGDSTPKSGDLFVLGLRQGQYNIMGTCGDQIAYIINQEANRKCVVCGSSTSFGAHP